MAEETKQTNQPQQPEQTAVSETANAPIGELDLFATSLSQTEKITADDLFAGNNEFLETLDDNQTAPEINNSSDFEHFIHPKKSSASPISITTLVAIAAFTVAIFTLAIFITRGMIKSTVSQISTISAQMASASQNLSTTAAVSSQQPAQSSGYEPATEYDQSSLPQGASLSIGQDFYNNREYASAFAVFESLHRMLPNDIDQQFSKDFLQMQMGLCQLRMANFDEADKFLSISAQSISPVVRIISTYQMIFSEIRKQQLLKAAQQAFKVTALTDAFTFDNQWSNDLQRQCQFLAAELITRQALALGVGGKDFPSDLWSKPKTIETIFKDIDSSKFKTVLNNGSEHFKRAILGPEINLAKQDQSSSVRWSVSCLNSPVEQLLSRFASNSNININWHLGDQNISLLTKDAILNRPLTMYCSKMGDIDIFKMAAGAAGLVAQIQQSGAKFEVNIFAPDQYLSSEDKKSALTNLAIASWQRFLIAWHGSSYSAQAHFVLGLLHSQNQQSTEANAEYKMVVHRFNRHKLAPYALLHSSKLKTSLHNYAGARKDLTELVEQFPNSKIVSSACINLADATYKTGLYSEAERLYKKAYYLGFSLNGQRTASFGVAKCAYNQKDYHKADTWLVKYLEIPVAPDSETYTAYFLMGQNYKALNQYQKASEAFSKAIQGPVLKEKYMKITPFLVDSYVQRGDFVKALNTIESISNWKLTQYESTELLILRASILRKMGLAQKAIMEISDRLEYMPDSELKGQLALELTKCHISDEQFKPAYEHLTNALRFVEPGPLAQEIQYNLAQTCIKLSQMDQAKTQCELVLASGVTGELKEKSLALLSDIYLQEEKYNKAILVISNTQD